ncbi:hypothetical protein JZ751_013153 [Albula glossodonta]|uniref:Uncharacterized protein n=1 Tax=Albula glossodonta TaxID=121402 RepID=A0A8T2P2B3_9TELE|nr:hypothetical protein JZ751_013153 [Albula glossodonta]
MILETFAYAGKQRWKRRADGEREYTSLHTASGSVSASSLLRSRRTHKETLRANAGSPWLPEADVSREPSSFDGFCGISGALPASRHRSELTQENKRT